MKNNKIIILYLYLLQSINIKCSNPKPTTFNKYIPEGWPLILGIGSSAAIWLLKKKMKIK